MDRVSINSMHGQQQKKCQGHYDSSNSLCKRLFFRKDLCCNFTRILETLTMLSQ